MEAVTFIHPCSALRYEGLTPATGSQVSTFGHKGTGDDHVNGLVGILYL